MAVEPDGAWILWKDVEPELNRLRAEVQRLTEERPPLLRCVDALTEIDEMLGLEEEADAVRTFQAIRQLQVAESQVRTFRDALEQARRVLVVAYGEKAPYIRIALSAIDIALDDPIATPQAPPT